MSTEEYLDSEARTVIRHEYVGGEVFTGGDVVELASIDLTVPLAAIYRDADID